MFECFLRGWCAGGRRGLWAGCLPSANPLRGIKVEGHSKLYGILTRKPPKVQGESMVKLSPSRSILPIYDHSSTARQCAK